MRKKYTVEIYGILPKTCEVLIADGNPLIQGIVSFRQLSNTYERQVLQVMKVISSDHLQSQHRVRRTNNCRKQEKVFCPNICYFGFLCYTILR